MFSLLCSLMLTIHTQDSVPVAPDSLETDTMREVTVRAGRHIPLPGMEINPALKEAVVPPPQLLDLLERRWPGIQDKIMHPFAFKQRRKEKRRARSLKALENYDRVKTFDELLREAYVVQQREDSLEQNATK